MTFGKHFPIGLPALAILLAFLAAVAGAAAGSENLIAIDFSKGVGPWKCLGAGGEIGVTPSPDDPQKHVLVLTIKGEGKPTAAIPEINTLKGGHTYRVEFKLRMEPLNEQAPKLTALHTWMNLYLGKKRELIQTKKRGLKWIARPKAKVGTWTTVAWEETEPKGEVLGQLKIYVIGRDLKLLIADPRITDVTNALSIKASKRVVTQGQRQRIVFHCRLTEDVRNEATLEIHMPGAKIETVKSPPAEIARVFRAAQPGQVHVKATLQLPGTAEPLSETLTLKVIPAIAPAAD